MSARIARVWGIVVLGTGFALVAPAVRAGELAQAAASIDLSGHWRFNRELSDDERAKVTAALEATAERQRPAAGSSGEAEGQGSEGGPAGQGGRSGRSRGMGSRTDRGHLSEGIDENDPRGARATAGPPQAMTVTQAQSEIVVEEVPGQTRNLYPDGKTYRTDEGATRITTRWKDGRLLVERKNARGWRLVETWDLAPDGGRVVIHLLLEGGSGPKLSLLRVYDRQPVAAAGPARTTVPSARVDVPGSPGSEAP
jgi:hypothetical protein